MSALNYIDFLPHELLFNIFILLSVKTLCNCKCVSKLWNFLISDPKFIKTHLSKTSISNNLTLVSTEQDRYSLYSVKFGDNNDGFARKLYKDSGKLFEKVWGSCNGLMLVEDPQKVMFLINPATLESYVLPVLHCKCLELRPYIPEFISYIFGFGYDCSCDDYVVVAICDDDEVYIYTLKSNKWTEAGDPTFDHSMDTFSPGVLLERSIHWIANDRFNNAANQIIAAFNLANKKFLPILLPDEVRGLGRAILELEVLMGSLCLTSPVRNGGIEIIKLWVMKEYGVVESWTKISINLTHDSLVVPLHLRENCLVLMEGGKFVLLETDGNEVTLQFMDVIGLPTEFKRGMTYVESLVSPTYNERDQV